MLKITMHDKRACAVLELEGRLVGPWVEELKRSWEDTARAGKPIRVLLKEVSFIDADGRTVLAEMHRQGVELVAEGCMIKAMIEQMDKEERS